MKISFLLILVLILSVAFANVRRDKGSDEQDGDNNEGSGHRDVTLENSGDKLKFESNNGFNKIKFELDISKEFEIRLKYYERSNDSKEFYRFRVRFYSLIEYTESNGIAGYQVGDTVVATQDLKDFDWTNIVCGHTGDRYDCSINSTGSNAGVIGFGFHVTGSMTPIGGIQLDPTSMKIDVNIDKANKASGNSLAIDVRFITINGKEITKESALATQDSEPEVTVSDISFYSWVQYAVQNGVNVSVISSTLETSTDDDVSESGERRRGDDGNSDIAHKMFFSFNTTANGPIFWDPIIGLNPDVLSVPSSAFTIAPCVALFFAVIVFLF